MSRFPLLDTVLAHDKSFREFFSALASGMPDPGSTSTGANSADPTVAAPAAGAVAPTTISGDSPPAPTDAGPHWAVNSSGNVGSLVDGTDLTQSSTMQTPHAPNVGTTSWNFQGRKWTIATEGNVLAFVPANFQHPTNNIDLKALLQAAAAHGLISSSEHFGGKAPGK